MLNEIQKTEQAVREQIEKAKHDASVAIQHAHQEVAAACSKLEEELRAKEATTIASIEEQAKQQATSLVEKARAASATDNPTETAAIAKEILALYIK